MIIDNCRSFGLRPKTWAYLMDDGSEHKNAKGTKKCVIKCRLMFEITKINEKIIFKKQQRFKSYYHDMYIEEINKVAFKVVMIIREYKDLIRLQHFHKKHLLLKCVKMKC